MNRDYELRQVNVRLRLEDAEPLYSSESITSPERAVSVMADVMAGLDREYCCVVNLDAGGRPINYNIVSIGNLAYSVVPARNVFVTAILSNAASVILLHNHPSGNVIPSREDDQVTEQLVNAGKILGIPVQDHIIIGGWNKDRYSYREDYPGMFEGPYHDIDIPKETKDSDNALVAEVTYQVVYANQNKTVYEEKEIQADSDDGAREQCESMYERLSDEKKKMYTTFYLQKQEKISNTSSILLDMAKQHVRYQAR